MQPNKHCILGLVVVLLLIITASCATELAGRTETLLQRQYQVMDDGQLHSYYRRLNDQLLQETRARREGGLLTRSGQRERLERLRQRWNEVRAVMKRRGLSP